MNEEKKNSELKDDELEQVVGGLKGRRLGYSIVCTQCKAILCQDVLFEQVQDVLEMYRATHKCPSAFFVPSDIVERHN